MNLVVGLDERGICRGQTDEMSGRGPSAAPGRAVGPAGVPGVARPPWCVWRWGPALVSWWPGRVLVFLFPGQPPCPCPEALALPACPPLPVTSAPSTSGATGRTPFPCLGPSRTRLTWVSSTGLLWLVVSPGGVVPSAPRVGNWLRRVVREGPGDAGTRQESVLPGRLWLWVLAVLIDMF